MSCILLQFFRDICFLPLELGVGVGGVPDHSALCLTSKVYQGSGPGSHVPCMPYPQCLGQSWIGLAQFYDNTVHSNDNQ